MKIIILIIFSITSLQICCAQSKTEFEYDNFENQFLKYQPKKHSQISEKDFDYGSMIIKETKSATKNNPENFNLADYFNILSAFLTLKENEKSTKIAYEKFENEDSSCEYVIEFENTIRKNPKYDIIRADYLKKLEKCKQYPIAEEQFNIEEYCKSNTLDIELVKLISQVEIDDQKYRNISPKDLKVRQQRLDEKNQEIIYALYTKYKTYLGKSLVGRKFESVMWSVIQHSNTKMMTEFLPIIHKAVKEKELDIVPLKMLIDRYYGLKYGYQIFGSQSGFGFELADDGKRKEIELKYGIE